MFPQLSPHPENGGETKIGDNDVQTPVGSWFMTHDHVINNNLNEKPMNTTTTDTSRITTAVVWDHRGRVQKGGMGQVEVRVTYKRKSYHFGTGVKCHKSELIAGQVVNCAGAKELNERVSIIYKKVLACVNEAIDGNGVINTDDIRSQVWRLVEEHSDEPTLLKWIDEQIQMLDVSSGTRKHYVSLQNRLEQYGKLRRWQDVTVEGIMNFDAWLHKLTDNADKMGAKAHGRLGKGLSNGAIYNYHKCLKALLRRADMFGKIERSPYERLHGQFDKGERENVEYLTEDEMHAIEKLPLTDGTTLCLCRDLFVFQMWTGLSYSDAEAFNIGDYKKERSGKTSRSERYVYVGDRIKTGVAYVSMLLPPAVAVLKKYDMKTPQIENHLYNRMLKAIGQMAGIKTRLHSHLARHSFATFMLSNGVPIEHVSKMVGHTNITQTQRYAKVLAEDVNAQYEKVAKKLKKSDR